MLDVSFTVDVEVWCNGWDDLDKKFPRAFEQYVYGRTSLHEAHQETELHLHIEWADESRVPILPHVRAKRFNLRHPVPQH